jgi:hypothetical protein
MGQYNFWTTGPFKIPLAREISVHEVDRYKRGDLPPPPPPNERLKLYTFDNKFDYLYVDYLIIF